MTRPMHQEGLSSYPTLPPPVYVVLNPSLTGYWRNVLSTVLTVMSDDGDLAVFLNSQIDEWEIQSETIARLPLSPERTDNHNHALAVITLLTDTLNTVRRRIVARIAAANASLGATYRPASGAAS